MSHKIFTFPSSITFSGLWLYHLSAKAQIQIFDKVFNVKLHPLCQVSNFCKSSVHHHRHHHIYCFLYFTDFSLFCIQRWRYLIIYSILIEIRVNISLQFILFELRISGCYPIYEKSNKKSVIHRIIVFLPYKALVCVSPKKSLMADFELIILPVWWLLNVIYI